MSGVRGLPIAERFWSKVLILGPNDCWPWQEYCTKLGYGLFYFDRLHHSVVASRVVWFLTYGVWPEECVLHNCPNGDNPACCNPRHLWLGTRPENSADMVAKARQTYGERNPNVKLTDRVIDEIRARYHTFSGTQEKLAKEYGVTQSVISRVIHGKVWRHLLGEG